MLYIGNPKKRLKKIVYWESMAQRFLIFARGNKGNYFLDGEFHQLIEMKLTTALQKD